MSQGFRVLRGVERKILHHEAGTADFVEHPEEIVVVTVYTYYFSLRSCT